MTDTALKDIFSYENGFLNLEGFPETGIITNLENVLASTRILRAHTKRVGCRNVVDAAFSPEHINARQEFFKELDSSLYKKLNSKFFENIDEIRVRDYSKKREFLDICVTAEELKTNLRSELSKLNVTEAKNILAKLSNFEADSEVLLQTIHRIDNFSVFYINVKEGIIAPAPAMPANAEKYSMDIPAEDVRADTTDIFDDTTFILDDIFNNVKFKLKGKALEISKRMKLNFKEKFIQFIRKEFRFSEKRDNIRSNYEALMLPLRINERYARLLENRGKFYCGDDMEDDEEENRIEPPIPDAVYPVFSNRYGIKGLFPLKLMGDLIDEYTPINFEANTNERKFLLAGLHSGGKSFFLENIILTSLVGQIGLKIPAQELVLPKYNHLFYYRSDESKRAGRLESELFAVNRIINNAVEKDLVVIDEFLDSTSSDIASWLGRKLLDKLLTSKATVFVSSHRDSDYKGLRKRGWTVLSPDHKIVDGKVKPTYILSRKLPDEKINMRYVSELYSGL